jgi:proton-translocating NADH-quinone oxidoreductase chain N
MEMMAWMIGLPLGAAPVLYLAGRVGIQRDQPGRRGPLVRMLALAALAVTWIPFVITARQILANGVWRMTFGAVALRVDGLSLLMVGLTLALGLLVTLYSGPYLAGEIGEEKYYAMLTTMIGVIIGLSCAADLFNLWVWFEAMAVSSYLLVAFYRRQASSLEAGIKYVVQSAVGSVLVLLGIALILAQHGTVDFSQIALAAAPATPLHMAAAALFVIGFGVKIAIVPLHTWLPDAHSQAPSGISAMLSGVVIEAGLLALLRTITPWMAGASLRAGTLLMLFGALNMLYGNLLALRQQQVKRLLAYSSLSHMGYMLLGVGIALNAGMSETGLNAASGAFFHVITHGLMKGLAFLAVGALLFALRLSHENHDPLLAEDLNGAAGKYPWTALSLSLALLALGGLPPLAGFLSKWQIFAAGFETHEALPIGLTIFAALNSVLSLGYYAPLVNRLYRVQASEIVQRGVPIPAALQFPLMLLALLVILLGVWPTLVSGLTQAAALAIR